MAEEEEKEIVIPETPQKKRKKKGGNTIFLVIGFLVIAIVGGGGYFMYGKTLFEQVAQKKLGIKAAVKKPEDKKPDEKKSADNKKPGAEKVEVGPIVPLEPFIINVAGDPTKFVKISVAVELKNEKIAEETKKISPAMRDVMLTVLGAKKPEVFMDINGRNAMKKELFDGINKLFADGGLKAVYITDIIMQ